MGFHQKHTLVQLSNSWAKKQKQKQKQTNHLHQLPSVASVNSWSHLVLRQKLCLIVTLKSTMLLRSQLLEILCIWYFKSEVKYTSGFRVDSCNYIWEKQMKIHSRTRKKKAGHFQTLDSIQTLILSVFKYLPATLPCYCSVSHREKKNLISPWQNSLHAS